MLTAPCDHDAGLAGHQHWNTQIAVNQRLAEAPCSLTRFVQHFWMFYKKIPRSLPALDTCIALTLPGVGRVGFSPSAPEFLVLAANLQVVFSMHVEADTGRSSTHFMPWLKTMCLEIWDALAFAINRDWIRCPRAIAHISTITINLTYCGHKVVQIYRPLLCGRREYENSDTPQSGPSDNILVV